MIFSPFSIGGMGSKEFGKRGRYEKRIAGVAYRMENFNKFSFLKRWKRKLKKKF